MEERERVDDQFLRLLLDLSPSPLRTGPYRAWLRGRGLTERFDRFATESRYLGEGTLGLSRKIGKSASVWSSGRLEGRSYPDSMERNFRRTAVSIGLTAGIRSGQINISGGFGGIDYRRTSWYDRRRRSFSLGYLRALNDRLDLRFLSEFEWSDYGRPAIKQVDVDTFEFGADQNDRGRLARLELHYLRHLFFELDLTWESVRSNSFGYSVGRRSAEVAVSGYLPGELLLQIRGRLESIAYHDRDLERVFIIRTGEDVEAGEDNNRLFLQLKRSVGRGVDLEARFSWFRNESLLVGEFYRKAVGSMGITWTPIGASDF